MNERWIETRSHFVEVTSIFAVAKTIKRDDPQTMGRRDTLAYVLRSHTYHASPTKKKIVWHWVVDTSASSYTAVDFSTATEWSSEAENSCRHGEFLEYFLLLMSSLRYTITVLFCNLSTKSTDLLKNGKSEKAHSTVNERNHIGTNLIGYILLFVNSFRLGALTK